MCRGAKHGGAPGARAPPKFRTLYSKNIKILQNFIFHNSRALQVPPQYSRQFGAPVNDEIHKKVCANVNVVKL